jgi:dihydroorotate dehydrogenase (NAD+) catalytic subunit
LEASEVEATPDLGVTLGPLRLPNPVMTASGTAGYGTEGLPGLVPEMLGAFVTKGLSLAPRAGNPPPRIAETPAGMLNAIGLENVGIAAFAAEHLPRLRRAGVRVIVNFFGETPEEFRTLAGRIDRLPGVVGMEMNVSCPNVRKGGVAFGRDPEALHELVRRVRHATGLPVAVKLAPDAVDLLGAAQAAWEAGADVLTVANTYMGLAVDVGARRPRLGIGTGGLSGPAIRPLTVYRVWRVARAAPIPVVGVGGIGCARDALEYLIAGASAVQVGSAAFGRPEVFAEIIDGIGRYLADGGHRGVKEIIGSLAEMPDPVG